MPKINLKAKKILDSFINLFIITIIISNRVNFVSAMDSSWIELSKTSTGIQYLDNDSLIKKDKGLIEIKTKYLKKNANSSKKNEESIYITKINCQTNKYKDISVNGKNNLKAKWEDPNGDKLINDLISYSCKSIKTH